MGERSSWQQLRDRRMAEPGAVEGYAAAGLACELGRAVREMRERRGWTQAQLADASGLTLPAVARFEAGGRVPTIPVLERLASALDAELVVRLNSRTSAVTRAAGVLVEPTTHARCFRSLKGLTAHPARPV